MTVKYQNPEVAVVTQEKDIAKCLQVRIKVFVDEQGYPLITETNDEHDPESTHWLLTAESEGERVPVGTVRMYMYAEKVGKLGRLAVLSEARGLRFGQMLVKTLCAEAHKHGLVAIVAEVQIDKRIFYEKLGFIIEKGDEEPFDVDGTPHLKMWKRSLP